MALSDTLISQKNSLVNMKGSVTDVSIHLKRASEKVQSAASNITSCFLVDDSGADRGEIQRLADAIRRIENGFNTDVISSINSEVSNLNNKITKQLTKEKEEAKKKEEEKKKKEQEMKEKKS